MIQISLLISVTFIFVILDFVLIIYKFLPRKTLKNDAQSFTSEIDMTVLIPMFNNFSVVESCLVTQLETYQSLSDMPLNVMLVDSSDSIKNCESLVHKFNMKNIKENCDYYLCQSGRFSVLYLKDRRGGKSWALNYALKFVKTEYLGILDADCIFNDSMFLEMCRFLQKNISFSYVQLAMKAQIDEKSWIQILDGYSFAYEHDLEDVGRIKLGAPVTLHGTGFVLRTLDLVNLNGFSKDVLSEDVDLTNRFLLEGKNGMILERKLDVLPATSFKEYFWQKMRWVEGRSQMLKKYFVSTITNPHLNFQQKLFWMHYLFYFFRYILFGVNLFLFVFSFFKKDVFLLYSSLLMMALLLAVRMLGMGVISFRKPKTFKKFVFLIFEPFFYYSIGVPYMFWFFRGLIRKHGVWRVFEK